MTGHVDALEQLGSELLALAAARGWAVAPWWAGGRAGSAPDTPLEALARVEVLGRHHETSLLGEERRTRGTHLTPAEEALALTQRVIERSGAVSSVLDPCCGAGVFLTAAQLLQSAPLQLHGWDLNHRALAWAWASFAVALPNQAQPPDLTLNHEDALLGSLPTCDLVLTNPPFRSLMRRVDASERQRLTRYRERWPVGAHGRADLSMIFLDAIAQCLADEGWLGAVLPEAQLGSQSGRPLRQRLCEIGTPRHLQHLGSHAFSDAAVRTCSLVWHKAAQAGGEFVAQDGCSRVTTPAESLANGDWAPHLVNPHHPPHLIPRFATQNLGALVTIRRLFTDDFYFVGRAITEANERHARPVMTVAHVDPGITRWGDGTVRIGGNRWSKPTLDEAALVAEDPVRAERLLTRWSRTRLALATRGAVIECVRLAAGEVAQVPLIELWSDDEDLTSLVYAQLLSPAPTAWYLQHHAVMDQTGAGVDLRAAAVKELPLIDPFALPAALRQRLIEQVDRLGGDDHAERLLDLQETAMELYEPSGSDALEWWWSRVPQRMTRPARFAAV